MFDVFATVPKKSVPEELVTLSVRMPKKLREDFTALCEKHQVELSEVVRQLIKNQLDLDAEKSAKPKK